MYRLSRLALLFLSFVLIAAPLSTESQVAASNRPTMPDRTPKYVPNQLLVRFRDMSTGAQTHAHARAQAREVKRFPTFSGLELVQLDPGVDLDSALAAYRSDPSVLSADRNYIRTALDNTPNDSYFHDLWNMHNTGQPILFPFPPSSGPTTAIPGDDIHALEAWGITTGSSNIVLGLIDTGIDVNHEDLSANIYRNEADCFNDGIDHDGNGYINDCNGFNVLDNNNDLTDVVDHGTHVAGIMGAVGNNGIGVTGVNWNVKIITCKFLGVNGGTDDGAIACMNYIATMKDRGVNIVATNNSWGGYGYSQSLHDAIDALRQRGILVVAAAGNDANDNDGLSPLYPASFALDNVIGVAANDFTDTLSYYSSFGTHTVAISAPGDYILSTTPDNSYSIYSGTSMATPHVTGVAGLLMAQDSTRNFKAVRNLILAGADTKPTVASSITHGRLNALNSLTCANRTVTAPLQPQSATVFANSGQPLSLSVLNINCGAPAGPPTVAITPGAAPVVFHDDGVAPDQDANDGIYAGQWTPSQSGLFSLAFPGGQQVQVASDPYSVSSANLQYRTFTGTNLQLTDDGFAVIQPPFPISYAGGAYWEIGVSDNGYISLDTFVPPTPVALPYAFANTLIAPFWDKLVPTATGNVYWTVNGTAPNRELVIEWRNMSHTGCKTDGSETVTFQLVLFEYTTDILFNYGNTVFGGDCTASDNGKTASAGVQATTSVAQQLSFEAASLNSNTAINWKSTLPSNALPSILAVYPTSWSTDIQDLFVELTGAKFGFNSVVLVNGVPAETFVFGSTDLFFDLPASYLKSAGTVLKFSVFNGSPGGGPSQAVSFPVNSPDFTLSASTNSLTVKAGQSVSTTIFAYPNPAFQNSVSLSCSGLPTNLSCNFNPATILTYGYASVTFSAKALSSSSPSLSASLLLGFPIAGLFWIGSIRNGAKPWRRRSAAILSVLMIGWFIGCGGGGASSPVSSNSSTTSSAGSTGSGGTGGTGTGGTGSGTGSGTSGTGTYQVIITGKSGSVQHTVTINVTVTS